MPESYVPEQRKPQLIWQGRSEVRRAEPLPSQVVEVVRPNQESITDVSGDLVQGRLSLLGQPNQARLGFGAAPEPLPPNRLIWTNDNLVALTSLLRGDAQHPPLEGKVDLIYIDPPFAVQSDFTINVEIEHGAADEKQPTLIEELAYRDTWKNGLDSYLSMMRDRLDLLKRLLAPTGSIYVHCDWHAGHYLKVLLDEVFGYERFQNQIVWRRTTAHADAHGYGLIQDFLLYYTCSDQSTFHTVYQAYNESYVASHYSNVDSDGRRYQLGDMTAPGPRPGLQYTWKGVDPPRGRVWAVLPEKMTQLDREGRLHYTKNGMPRYKRFLDEMPGTPAQDIWDDIPPVNPMAAERIGFPTQKPLALLQRIIVVSTNPGDLVLDAFAGSGTTAVAAETMKDADGKPAPRRWIAIDCSKFAVHITRKRMIEANARPFSVENVGFYARASEWKDLWAEQPAARVYRDAMVEIYGGTPVEGYAHLHGRKGSHWVHIGPLDAPVATMQVQAIAAEAGTTDCRAVDILSADIPIDWDRTTAEREFGVAVYAKIIPQAAIDAVRERIRRQQRRDPTISEGPQVHFFSPPDVEVRLRVRERVATVTLTRLTVDLDDCLSTQDPARRAELRQRITDWKALIDYWAVDWDWQQDEPFMNDWQAFRTRRNRQFPTEALHDYATAPGGHRIAVKVTDIFGNDGLRVVDVVI